MDQQLTLDQRTESAMNMARILYAVHGLTFFFSLGLLSIIPLFFNYSNLAQSEGTIVHSHHRWMIRSFWWYAGWMLVSWVIVIFTLGFGIILAAPIWGIVWLWKAYRLIRGFIDLNNNRAMPI